MNEHDALAMLDERMREATTELRHAIDAATPAPVTGEPMSTAPDRPAPVIPLDGSSMHESSGRRWWIAAAAALAVVGVAGVILIGGDDADDPPPATTNRQPFLVPGELPSGWKPVLAARGTTSPEKARTVAVYASEAAEDPVRGDMLIVMRSPVVEQFTSAEAEQIEVAGHEATIESEDSSWNVAIDLEEGTLSVSGRGIDRDTVLDAAGAAVTGEAIEPTLPAGMVERLAGPLGVPGEAPARGVTLAYADASRSRTIAISQRPGDAKEVGLSPRFYLLDTYETSDLTVRGQRAVLFSEDDESTEGPDIVQWIEPPGLLVTVYATELSGDELVDLIEGMRQSTGAEIDDLVARHPAPPTTSNGEAELREGEVLVAEGDRGGYEWRVTAEASGQSLDLWYEAGQGGFGTSTGPGSGVGPLDVSTNAELDSRDEAAVIGSAAANVRTVVVEAAGQPPLPLELHRRDELRRTVIVGFVPRAYLGGDVVARDRRDREVARVVLEDLNAGFDDSDGDDDGGGTMPPTSAGP